ncbi:uncharacterized protein RJT20DRAFT_3742 [Scheffersomyces xylosifermentans]|uniref:uncharacterized protein n=1 Tax=Scheffersomyces xylosifermentans TaxID=1304137 RepID=UPI00315D0E6B
MTSTGTQNHNLIDSINDCLFNSNTTNINYCNFPLVLTIPYSDTESYNKLVKTIEDVGNLIINTRTVPRKHLQVCLSNCDKATIDTLVYKLYDAKVVFNFDYSKFISHPGILFIKNLSSELVFKHSTDSTVTINIDDKEQNSLFQYLQEESHFKSLHEVKLFRNDNSSGSFAIVKFDNYLDVEILIEKLHKHTPNKFNTSPNTPLFLNRYLNKRERFTVPPSAGAPLATTSPTSSSPIYNNNGESKTSDNFELIVIENLSNFLPKNLTSLDFYQFIAKFKAFGSDIESIYFPIVGSNNNILRHDEALPETSSTALKCLDYGYIQFKPAPHLMENTLRILYYINNLTWDDFCELDTENLKPLLASVHTLEDEEEDPIEKSAIKVTIAQHKHNHYLYINANNYFLSWTKDKAISISFPNPLAIINLYSKHNNFQETNIYVNNLPQMFNNDDSLWETFWKQFGSIKSAKIIKPEFYSNDNNGEEKSSKSGKIGFVFYESFKMATRAILLTNNKLISLHGSNHPVLIQSSFAIQKSNSKPTNYSTQIPILPTNNPIPLSSIPIPPSSSSPQRSIQPGSHSHSQSQSAHIVPVYPYLMVPQVQYYNPYYYQNSYPPHIPVGYPNNSYHNSKGRKHRGRSTDHTNDVYYPYSGRMYQNYYYEESYDGNEQ